MDNPATLLRRWLDDSPYRHVSAVMLPKDIRDALEAVLGENERMRTLIDDYGTGPCYQEDPAQFADRVILECNAAMNQPPPRGQGVGEEG